MILRQILLYRFLISSIISHRGQKKARCVANGSLSGLGDGWSGLALISSETPIQDSQRQNQGLQTRVLQTQGITWTPSAEVAEQVKRIVEANYGHIGQGFAEYVGQLSDDDLLSRFNNSKIVVRKYMRQRDALSDRIEAKYTVIALTIELMNEHFSLSLDVDELIRILIKPEQDAFADRDIAYKGQQAIINHIIGNKSRYSFLYRDVDCPEHDYIPSGINQGTIVYKDNNWYVYIPTDIVTEILKSAGINEVATVEKRWRDSGLIRCDSDRLTTKCTASLSLPYYNRRCICFVFRGGLQMDLFRSDYPTNEPVRRIVNTTPPVTPDIPDDEEAIDAIFKEGK